MTEHCRVCSSPINEVAFQGRLIGRLVNFYDCSFCGYVQTESPTWLNQAYLSPITISDTGVMVRNLANLQDTIATLALLGKRRGHVVDWAGGYGILVRLLRDNGVDAYWHDLYATNLLARGFEFGGGSSDLITLFEAFEHFVFPMQEVQKLVRIAPNIILSTLLIPSPAPAPASWWYYGQEHGQHIGFFRLQTLRFIAEQFDLCLMSNGHSLHLLTKKRFSKTEWMLLRQIAKLNLKLLTRNLGSKTWNDYQKLQRPNQMANRLTSSQAK